MSPEPVSEDPERLFSIIVVTVDHCERLLYDFLAHENGMSGSPWLLAVWVEGEL